MYTNSHTDIKGALTKNAFLAEMFARGGGGRPNLHAPKKYKNLKKKKKRSKIRKSNNIKIKKNKNKKGVVVGGRYFSFLI